MKIGSRGCGRRWCICGIRCRCRRGLGGWIGRVSIEANISCGILRGVQLVFGARHVCCGCSLTTSPIAFGISFSSEELQFLGRLCFQVAALGVGNVQSKSRQDLHISQLFGVPQRPPKIGPHTPAAAAQSRAHLNANATYLTSSLPGTKILSFTTKTLENTA